MEHVLPRPKEYSLLTKLMDGNSLLIDNNRPQIFDSRILSPSSAEPPSILSNPCVRCVGTLKL
jgi:hypothetical protein